MAHLFQVPIAECVDLALQVVAVGMQVRGHLCRRLVQVASDGVDALLQALQLEDLRELAAGRFDDLEYWA